jgi:hypothetical protein
MDMKPKRDWSKYAGFSREEVNRRIAEEDNKPMREAIATLQKQAEENQRRRESEAEQRRLQQQEKRRAQARRELEDEKASKLRTWLDAGGNEQSFERAWPLLEQQYLMSKLPMTDEERERRASSAGSYAHLEGTWKEGGP